MSTLEIADLLDMLDDSDVDPDRDLDFSSSACSDDEVEHDVPLQGAASSAGEHWFYMEPPVERADVETDYDSSAWKDFLL